MNPTEIERFWSHVDTTGGPDACWHWLRGCDDRGYGMLAVRVDGEEHTQRAHRVVWTLTFGAPEHHVLHSCDNPPCCNPRHLFEGPHAVNMADMVAKRRHQFGEQHSGARLTDTTVMEARRRYAEGEQPHVLAADYQVSTRHMRGVLSGRFWKHLPTVRYTAAAAEHRHPGRPKTLTAEQEKAIQESPDTVLTLADRYQVSPSTIYKVRRSSRGPGRT